MHNQVKTREINFRDVHKEAMIKAYDGDSVIRGGV